MKHRTSGLDSCGPDSICWNVSNETGKGTCVEQCRGSEKDPICSPGSTCVAAGSGVLALCLPLCNPLTQDCPNMNLCLPNLYDDGFICVLDASGREGQEWDPCGYANACDPGLFCAAATFASECLQDVYGCCLPFCDISVNPAMCKGQGQECLPFYEMGMTPPQFEKVGFCGIPM